MSAGGQGYVGRFAPSPTGPLHFGSLIAAIASYAQARAANGRWLLRIEDIDPPREPPGADKVILEALEAYGFEWDGALTYQSRFTPQHEAIVDQLLAEGLAYPCSCSRKDLAAAPRGPLGAIYPGTCRDGADGPETAIRLRTDDTVIEFTDGLQGPYRMQLQSESGDFVIRRRDGLIAYHLAVVVDDHAQGITEIVRGVDLLETTPRHIWLQRILGYGSPAYLHIPVAMNTDGQKLSKLTGAAGVPLDRPQALLVEGLAALGQAPPADLAEGTVADTWDWAIRHWRLGPMSGKREISAAEFGYG